jgi:hypothetical protein
MRKTRGLGLVLLLESFVVSCGQPGGERRTGASGQPDWSFVVEDTRTLEPGHKRYSSTPVETGDSVRAVVRAVPGPVDAMLYLDDVQGQHQTLATRSTVDEAVLEARAPD